MKLRPRYISRATALGAIACGFAACQSTKSPSNLPPVRNDDEIIERDGVKVITPYKHPPTPAGDWNQGKPVSESQETGNQEG